MKNLRPEHAWNNGNVSLTQLSLAYLNQFAGVTSTIIGATNLEQLDEDILAFELHLSDTAIAEINDVIKQYPLPF